MCLSLEKPCRLWVIVCLLPASGWSEQPHYETPYAFTTLAGHAQTSVDGAVSTAFFRSPIATAVDHAGNVYVADWLDCTIRKIAPDGIVTTLAGMAGVPGSTDGQASEARFRYPQGIAIDEQGNLYVADTRNATIRKVSPTGMVTTLAGTAESYGADDGTGPNASFRSPQGIALDPWGNIYVADNDNYTIRKITSFGVVTTLAGAVGRPGKLDGSRSDAQFSELTGLTVDLAGNIFVADALNHSIRKVTAAGLVSTVAGGTYAYEPRDGTGPTATFGEIAGIVTDGSGNLYVSDSGTIRKVTPAGEVITIIGSGNDRRSIDGPANVARFASAYGLTTDRVGNIYLVENGKIRKIDWNGTVTTVAGTNSNDVTDGIGSAARFDRPQGVAVDSAGNVFVADVGNHTIRKITAAGVVTTYAGAPGIFGSSDGPSNEARFCSPQGIAVDAADNVYIADSNNHTIRKITRNGLVSTVAGIAGKSGATDGPVSAATFNSPASLAVDSAGNIWVADYGNDAIRKITSGGQVETFPTGPGWWGRFRVPLGIAADSNGNIFVADSGNGTIWMIDKNEELSISAGHRQENGIYWAWDGPPGSVGFNFPEGVATDRLGNVYVADTRANSIRKIAPDGATTTLAGSGHQDRPGAADGIGPAAFFAKPGGIAVDASGKIYVADTQNNTIRVGVRAELTPTITTLTSSRTIVTGYATTLVAKARGWPTPTLQWQKNGVAIPGANSDSYLIDRPTLDDSGSYTLVATSSIGSTTSEPIVISVIPHRPNQADFNGDRSPDLIWSNRVTGERAVWLMNGVNFLASYSLGVFPREWSIAATADFDRDGSTDLVWANSVTGEHALWLMNGPGFRSVHSLGIFSLHWTLVATGDFNGDGETDAIWSNRWTRERVIRLMKGTGSIADSTLGYFPPEWTVAAAGDFSGDHKADIIWSNSTTGERAIWLMDGTTFVGASSLGIFPLEWTVVGTADFNGDGASDIIWSNSVTGERALWLMNGTQFLGASTLGVFPLEWTVSN